MAPALHEVGPQDHLAHVVEGHPQALAPDGHHGAHRAVVQAVDARLGVQQHPVALGIAAPRPMVADRAAPFAHASTFITVPLEDMLDKPSTSMLANFRAARQRLTPEDMLAVAFNGLARRRMRGAKRPGEDVATFAQNLRGLADALEAFNNYRPGTFLAGDEVKDLAKRDREKP